MQIVAAESAAQIERVRELFREYASALEVDLCFQGFEQELAGLPGRYAAPDGRLFLALAGEAVAGCVGLRKIADEVCEIKRLYVRPAFRGQGTGRGLAEAVIGAARQSGYSTLRLDTLPSMKEAIALYRSLGFKDAKPYYETCGVHSVFMELELRQGAAHGPG